MLNIPHEHQEWIFIGAGNDGEVNGATQRHELAKVAIFNVSNQVIILLLIFIKNNGVMKRHLWG